MKQIWKKLDVLLEGSAKRLKFDQREVFKRKDASDIFIL
jgi:hypothetical protein